MTAVGVAPSEPIRAPSQRAAGRAVTGLATRQVWRGAAAVTAVSSVMSAVVVASHAGAVADASTAAALETLAGNPAIRTLFGEPFALDDPGGFAVWRTGTVLGVLIAVWALSSTTRVLRGEEDAGRWSLLLGGRLPAATVVAGHIAVLVLAVLAAGLAVVIGLVGAGAQWRGAVVHGLGLALTGAFFVALAAAAAQVFGSRSAASAAAATTLLLSLLLRMVGDGVPGLGWSRWLSPFGLLALTRPFHDDAIAPLVVLAVAAAALAGCAVALAGRRDVGDGVLAATGSRASRLTLLGSPARFAIRCAIRPWLGWAAAVGAYYGLVGVLAESMTAFLADNVTFADLAAQAGFGSLTAVTGYAATLLALLAIPAGVYAAVRLAAVATAERDRTSTLLLAQPVTRVRLVLGEIAVAGGGAIGLLLVAGSAMWAGAAIVGAGLAFPAAIAGALNVLPAVALAIGAAVFALGRAPGAVAAAGATPVVGGFVLHVLAESAGAPTWVVSLSPFAHLAAVPHEPPAWTAAGVLVATAAALAARGAVAYRKRDLLV